MSRKKIPNKKNLFRDCLTHIIRLLLIPRRDTSSCRQVSWLAVHPPSAPSQAEAQWLSAEAVPAHSRGDCTGFAPVSLCKRRRRFTCKAS